GPGGVPPPTVVPGPTFTPADLRHALDILDLVFQDEEPREGEVGYEQNTLVADLRERGLTRALALALIEDLIAKGVFRAGEEVVHLKIFVSLGGEQTDEVTPNRNLYISRASWYAHLAKQRHRDSDPEPAQQRPKGGRDKKLEARDRWLYKQCCKTDPQLSYAG